MNEGTLISIDPGSSDPTGAAIYDCTGKLIITGSVRYLSAVNYAEQFSKIITRHNVKFALIENYVVFQGPKRYNSHNVVAQIQQLTEIFQHHILVNPAQWNGQKWKDQHKRQIAFNLFGNINFPNSHETDAALMGSIIWRKAEVSLGADAWDALYWLARSKKKKWPTMNETSLFYLYQEYLESLKQAIKREKMVAV